MTWIRKNVLPAICLVAGLVVGGVGVMGGMEHNGWMSPDTAQQMAMKQTASAVVAEVTPYCVDRFIHLPDASKQLKGLQSASGDGSGFITRLNLARAPGAVSDSPFAADIASMCAERVRAFTEIREAKSQSCFIQLFEPLLNRIVDTALPLLIQNLTGGLAR